MTIEVTVDDHDTDEQESAMLDGVSHILVVNEAAGFYLDGETRYSNGTIVLTIKRDKTGDSR